jgi:hypothetical protein
MDQGAQMLRIGAPGLTDDKPHHRIIEEGVRQYVDRFINSIRRQVRDFQRHR